MLCQPTVTQAPHRRSPANLRARESATTYLHPSAASPASAVGTGLKQKKQKKRLHSAPHTVFEASLLLCIESFARHTIRRPAASLPVRVRPELRAERYRRPQRVRRAQSPAWFTLPSEVTLSLSRSPSGLVSLGGCSAFQANRGAPYAKVGDFGHKSGS
jgi:hypothetical protein